MLPWLFLLWFVLALPVGMLVGRFLRTNSDRYPPVESDENLNVTRWKGG